MSGRRRRSPVLLDVEGGESLGLFGLDGDGFHDGQAWAGVRPVEQAADIFGWALEDRFDPAVGQVAHPAGDAVLLGQPPQLSRKKTPCTRPEISTR